MADEYTLVGVMHFVDKWLDGKELELDEVNRAILAREKALEAIETLQKKVMGLEKALEDEGRIIVKQNLMLLDNDDCIERLRQQTNQLRKERDAAIADINCGCLCTVCANEATCPWVLDPISNADTGCNFAWRGLQEEVG